MRAVGLLSSLAVVGCLAAPDEGAGATVAGITAGAPTEGDPAVVAIVRADAPTTLRCTGTLVADRVVLSAAHCRVQDEPRAMAVFFGSDLRGAGTRVAVLDAVAHPAYDESADADLALLLLAEPAPTERRARFEAAPASAPAIARLVGFGLTAIDAGDDDRKREGTSQVSELTPTYLSLQASPSLPCHGDSGGPVFVEDSNEALIAVMSRGDAECGASAKATRVDAHLDGFIGAQMDAWAPGSVPLAAPCLYDAQCETERCVAAVDDPSLQFCSAPCESTRDCAEPLVCREGMCRHPTPSPGALGSSCIDESCARGECLEEEQLCSTRCVTGRGDCPTGFECEHLGGTRFYCMPAPSPSRGCAAAPGPASPVMMAIVAVWLVRRRRGRGPIIYLE